VEKRRGGRGKLEKELTGSKRTGCYSRSKDSMQAKVERILAGLAVCVFRANGAVPPSAWNEREEERGVAIEAAFAFLSLLIPLSSSSSVFLFCLTLLTLLTLCTLLLVYIADCNGFSSSSFTAQWLFIEC
jgi:hypothetical protein